MLRSKAPAEAYLIKVRLNRKPSEIRNNTVFKKQCRFGEARIIFCNQKRLSWQAQFVESTAWNKTPWLSYAGCRISAPQFACSCFVTALMPLHGCNWIRFPPCLCVKCVSETFETLHLVEKARIWWCGISTSGRLPARCEVRRTNIFCFFCTQHDLYSAIPRSSAVYLKPVLHFLHDRPFVLYTDTPVVYAWRRNLNRETMVDGRYNARSRVVGIRGRWTVVELWENESKYCLESRVIKSMQATPRHHNFS